MWVQVAIIGGLFSLVPMWRGGQYSRKNGANAWQAIHEMMIRKDRENTHILVEEAIDRARKAYLSCN